MSGWESFSPWLERIERLEEERIWTICSEVPPEWYGGDLGEMEGLAEHLIARRSRIREQIEAFRDSSRQPFPQWGKNNIAFWSESFREGAEGNNLRAGGRADG